jgi:hypothetical protein
MSAAVIPLPRAATSFLTVRPIRGMWGVELVTPAGPKLIRSVLASYGDPASAIARATEVGAAMQRPVRLPRARQ